jgi:N-acetylglucosaminyl-diphospho-decaprenol L-rhamnosyltransferase
VNQVPELVVITVSYHSDEVLPGFISSVRTATRRPHGIVIADNAPTEHARAIAVRAGAEYLPMTRNAGYGGAVNAAVRTLGPDVQWILISNPDVQLLPDSVDILLEHLTQDPQVGAAGPRVLNADGSTYPSARAVPSLRTGIGHALFANIWKANPWTRTYRADSDHDDSPRDAGWLSGSCLLVRRDAFGAVGGFDEGYFMYFEDVDLGVRLAEAGYRNLYVPAAHVLHSGAHSTSGEAPRMIAAHHESARRFIGRRYRGPLLAPIRWAIYGALTVRSWLLQRQAVSRPTTIDRMLRRRSDRPTRK